MNKSYWYLFYTNKERNYEYCKKVLKEKNKKNKEYNKRAYERRKAKML